MSTCSYDKLQPNGSYKCTSETAKQTPKKSDPICFGCECYLPKLSSESGDGTSAQTDGESGNINNTEDEAR